MHKLTGRLLRLALSSALALGLATTAIGAAQAVDIKMWNLTNVGYPEYIAMATAEYKKTHPDVNIVFEQFPNEAYKTTIQVALTGSEPPDVFFNWAGEDAARLVRDGPGARHHRVRRSAGRLQAVPLRGLAVVVRV